MFIIFFKTLWIPKDKWQVIDPYQEECHYTAKLYEVIDVTKFMKFLVWEYLYCGVDQKQNCKKHKEKNVHANLKISLLKLIISQCI